MAQRAKIRSKRIIKITQLDGTDITINEVSTLGKKFIEIAQEVDGERVQGVVFDEDVIARVVDGLNTHRKTLGLDRHRTDDEELRSYRR